MVAFRRVVSIFDLSERKTEMRKLGRNLHICGLETVDFASLLEILKLPSVVEQLSSANDVDCERDNDTYPRRESAE